MSVDKDERRVFHTLDGLRGVAALFVAMRHTALFHHVGIYGGYLAVDLFFVLSGFVIAHAYERRLAGGLSVGRFMALRYLRLWPVYVLGALLGVLAAVLHAFVARDNLTPAQIGDLTPFALVMLPGPHIKAALYPLNSVAWSLGLELMVNLAYALVWRPLQKPWVLACVVAASAVVLIVSTCAYGSLDVGFTWVKAWGGVPRVLFSFSAGLAIYRLRDHEAWSRLRIPAWAFLPLLSVLVWLKIDPVVYPLICVLAVFPMMVLAATQTEPGPRVLGVYSTLGLISYPLYTLHKPAGEILVRLAPQTLHWTVWAGVPYLAALAGLCLLIERYYDRPARRMLMVGLDRAIIATKRRLGLFAGEFATDQT